MNKKILLFDVDGTIAEPGQNINFNIGKLITNLKNNCHYEIGIVGGGSYIKIISQLDNNLNCDHIFSECGSVYHKFSDNSFMEIYKANLREHPLYPKINILIKQALLFLSNVDYCLTGQFIDLRNGLIYISLIGLVATQKERYEFIELDKKNNYRQNLLSILLEKAREYQIEHLIDIKEGGSVGIAIYPKEWNKLQVLNNLNNYSEIHYFGDKWQENGNDYEIINSNKVIGHSVNNLNDTIMKLNNLLNKLK
jgi:phosphomannomutase